MEVRNADLYTSFLSKMLPYLAGQAEAPVPLDHMLESERLAIAARWSWMHGGITVALNDIPLADAGYDGAAFAAAYRLSKLG